tara:strand:- start:1784 stop:2509 length:726 start_codon:yes stop_codon:yes gene_type:complete
MSHSPSILIKGSVKSKETFLFEKIDIEIENSVWNCFIGTSGVGKSTILRLIAGLDTHVILNGGISFSNNKKNSFKVSYMSQSDLLLPWATVSKNITIGSKIRGEGFDILKKTKIIENVGLSNHLHKYPNQLSGGQKQRVALARTLMEDTEIVLLDEPFNSLDAKTKEEMYTLTVNELRGKTVILVTHDPNEAVRLCSKIYLLKKNKISLFENLTSTFPKSNEDKNVFIKQNELLKKILEDD